VRFLYFCCFDASGQSPEIAMFYICSLEDRRFGTHLRRISDCKNDAGCDHLKFWKLHGRGSSPFRVR
jgi:hypothetical protein